MTSFLTFAVTAVRISGDIPTQSEYLPLITLYMILSMAYTFIGLLVFILIESFLKNKKIPGLFLIIPFCVRNLFFFRKRYQVNKEDNVQTNETNEENQETTSTRAEQETNEAEEKYKTNEFEENLLILKYFLFILFFLFISSSNLSLWCALLTNDSGII